MDAPEEDLMAQEEKEIKFFRNVHTAILPSPKEDETAVDVLEGLEFGAQIYCRNIRDRYPLLPIYLTRRLAQANFRRSERLRSQGLKVNQPSLQDNAQPTPSINLTPYAGNAGSTILNISPTESDVSAQDERLELKDLERQISSRIRAILGRHYIGEFFQRERSDKLEMDVTLMRGYRDRIQSLLVSLEANIHASVAVGSDYDRNTMEQPRSITLNYDLSKFRRSMISLSAEETFFKSVDVQLELIEM